MASTSTLPQSWNPASGTTKHTVTVLDGGKLLSVIVMTVPSVTRDGLTAMLGGGPGVGVLVGAATVLVAAGWFVEAAGVFVGAPGGVVALGTGVLVLPAAEVEPGGLAVLFGLGVDEVLPGVPWALLPGLPGCAVDPAAAVVLPPGNLSTWPASRRSGSMLFRLASSLSQAARSWSGTPSPFATRLAESPAFTVYVAGADVGTGLAPAAVACGEREGVLPAATVVVGRGVPDALATSDAFEPGLSSEESNEKPPMMAAARTPPKRNTWIALGVTMPRRLSSISPSVQARARWLDRYDQLVRRFNA